MRGRKIENKSAQMRYFPPYDSPTQNRRSRIQTPGGEIVEPSCVLGISNNIKLRSLAEYVRYHVYKYI